MSPVRTTAATLALTAALGVLAGCGSDPTDSTADDSAGDPSGSGSPGGSPSASTSTSAPVSPTDSPTDPTSDPTTPSAAPAPPSSTAAASTVRVPVFFVGDTPQGARLFRELRDVPADDPLGGAAALMTAGDALDPDYRTAYPGGAFAGVEHTGDRFRVVLPDDGWTTPADLGSSDDAVLAAQQLVRTLRGAQRSDDPVEVFVGDRPVPLFGVDTAGGIRPVPPLDVLGLVNVTRPTEGATVSGRLRVRGLASSFEATVPWEVRRGEEVVLEGFSTAKGWANRLYAWTATVDVASLPPGEYTFAARTDDPSGGEGPGPTEDTKTVVVR